MNDTAIQQDVEKEVPKAISARHEAMASIAERSRQERDEEIKNNGGEVVDTLNVEENTEVEEEVKDKPEDEVKAEEPETTEVEEPKPEVVKIKVDGEEREVPKDKILDAGIRALQKESTADKRLEEATRLLREIEQKYVKPQKEEESTPSQEWDDATIAYALEHGNEEQKAYAVSQLRGRSMPTQEELVAQAEQRVLDKVDFRDSSQWFASEYQDIVNDPYLFQLAAVAEDRARASGDTRPRRELYKSIGDDLRKWRGGVTATTSLEEKKSHKSKIDNPPSASVKKSTPAEAKPKSASDVIEEMRKRRGQA